MNKLMAILMAGILLLMSCARLENLSEEEKEKYKRSNQRYRMMQTP